MTGNYRVYKYNLLMEQLAYKIYPKELFDKIGGWNHWYMWWCVCSFPDEDKYDEEAKKLFLWDIEHNRDKWLYWYNENYLNEIYDNIKNKDVVYNESWV